jgi:hypothetical protein
VALSDDLATLSERAKSAETTVKAAADKGQAELNDLVDKSRHDAQDAAAALAAKSADVTGQASAWWTTAQGQWTEHVAKVRQGVEDAKASLDADRAERRAERAEADAIVAIAYAYAAIDEAEYAVLDAALARAEADQPSQPAS